MIAEPYICIKGPKAGTIDWVNDDPVARNPDGTPFVRGGFGDGMNHWLRYDIFEREKLRELGCICIGWHMPGGFSIVTKSMTYYCSGEAEIGYDAYAYRSDSESSRLLKRAEFLKAVCEKEGVEWIHKSDCPCCTHGRKLSEEKRGIDVVAKLNEGQDLGLGDHTRHLKALGALDEEGNPTVVYKLKAELVEPEEPEGCTEERDENGIRKCPCNEWIRQYAKSQKPPKEPLEEKSVWWKVSRRELRFPQCAVADKGVLCIYDENCNVCSRCGNEWKMLSQPKEERLYAGKDIHGRELYYAPSKEPPRDTYTKEEVDAKIEWCHKIRQEVIIQERDEEREWRKALLEYLETDYRNQYPFGTPSAIEELRSRFL